MAKIVFYGIYCKGQLEVILQKIASSFIHLENNFCFSFLPHMPAYSLCNCKNKYHRKRKPLMQSTSVMMLPQSCSIIKKHLRNRDTWPSLVGQNSFLCFFHMGSEEFIVCEGPARFSIIYYVSSLT